MEKEVAEIGDIDDLLEDLEKEVADTVSFPDGRFPEKSNLVRMGKQALPERVYRYRRLTGERVGLATADYQRLMRKRDAGGGRAFVKTLEECVTQPQPIEQTCEVCLQRGSRKIFRTEDDWEIHMEDRHPTRWRNILRDRERMDRQEQRDLILAAIKGTQVREVINEFKCEQCGKTFKAKVGLIGHQRTHLSAVRN